MTTASEVLIGDDVSLHQGCALTVLPTLAAKSVRCCVTSPPYWGLRDYGTATWQGGKRGCEHRGRDARTLSGGKGKQYTNEGSNRVFSGDCVCGARRIDQQLGLESTPEQYVASMVAVFREVRRVLADDGTLWLNLGDSYCSTAPGTTNAPMPKGSKENAVEWANYRPETPMGMKAKDLVGIPWAVAFALRADGWYLRQDIIWCLSGGTYLYARTQKGDMPAMIRDLARLDPSTVKLWNGEKWTQVLGWSRTSRNADELELVLRSGERIGCTPTHQFPTSRGLLKASEIVVGDHLRRVRLPEPDEIKKPAHIGLDAAWLAGLYIAEGSMSGDTIQLAGHASQEERYARVSKIAADYGGSATCTIDGNNQTIRVYGKLLVAIIRELVSGRTAEDKCLAPVCWRYGNDFLTEALNGYLSGDGHHDEGNNRWRLGFTRNYNLERDLRTLAARLGFKLTLNPVFVDGFGKQWPAFKGEIRFDRSGHHNEKDTAEVIEIRKSRCREVYDVGVEDEPHLFALASGILTHNSKPNPMPESVTDRCTKAHEYLFLLSKSSRYYYDAEAIAEPCSENPVSAARRERTDNGTVGRQDLYGSGYGQSGKGANKRSGNKAKRWGTNETELREDGDGEVETHRGIPWEGSDRNKRSVWTITTKPFKEAHFAVMPKALVDPCIRAGSAPGDMILDPFGGSGTVAEVAMRLGRKSTLIELNPKYVAIAQRRLHRVAGVGAGQLFSALEAQE